jgi:uncharacterized protein YbaR (Trm112 family)
VFVELIETLRCPRPHEEAQLVATASRTEARHIVEGVLGCPICGAEFTIENGVARFGEPGEETWPEKPDPETAMRLAAFLELTDARGFALLCGRWGVHADSIHQLAETQLVLVNPPRTVPVDIAAGVVVTGESVPFAAGAARALALDAPASREFARSAVRAVRAGGRVVGPAALELPEGVTELVRDERMWVGEKTAAPDATPRLVSITKAAR